MKWSWPGERRRNLRREAVANLAQAVESLLGDLRYDGGHVEDEAKACGICNDMAQCRKALEEFGALYGYALGGGA